MKDGGFLDHRSCLAERACGRVDDECGFETEEVTRHRREHETQIGMHRRHFDGLHRAREAVFASRGDHDRRGAVRAVVRDLLRDVVGVRATEPDRAHEDQRLGAQVDVLLVLGDVGRDGAVTQLRELDPELVGGDAVETVPDHRPVPARRHVTERDRGDRLALREHLVHRVGQRPQVDEQCMLQGGVEVAELAGQRERQEVAGGDLGVERLRRRDGHFEVAPVGRVENAVGLVDEVAVPPVHDREHRGVPRAREIDRSVGVGRRTALADRDDECVGHVVGETEARRARWQPSPRRAGANPRTA